MTKAPMQQQPIQQQTALLKPKLRSFHYLSLRNLSYGVLALILLSAWFFYRHYVPYSTDNKEWTPVAASLHLPAAVTVPADILTAFQSSKVDDSAKQQQAFIERGDGALLADYFVRLYGIYHKNQQRYAVLSFSDKAGTVTLKHLAADDEYSDLRVKQLSSRVVVLTAGKQQITLTLFRPQPVAGVAGEKS